MNYNLTADEMRTMLREHEVVLKWLKITRKSSAIGSAASFHAELVEFSHSFGAALTGEDNDE